MRGVAIYGQRAMAAVRRVGLVLLVGGSMVAAVRADDTQMQLDAREAALAGQLRCVVCQNQTVEESRAPMAADMRREIRQQLTAGRSDAEVIAFFEQRYGAFVRYDPPWQPSTWLLWCGPFLAVLGGFFLLRRTLRARRADVVPLTAGQRQRAQAWLDQRDEEEPS